MYSIADCTILHTFALCSNTILLLLPPELSLLILAPPRYGAAGRGLVKPQLRHM